MRSMMLALLGALLLTACGTRPYTPVQYPLRDGLISKFNTTAPVQVINAQPSTEQTIVYSYSGMKLSATLNTITETMVQQTAGELAKNTQSNGVAKAKTIELKVASLQSRYIAFFWKSNIVYEARLGNGALIEKTVPHSSGDLFQDLNGCIAEGVMNLLNDEKVRAYLAS
ncbi:hypothetical protein [Solimonas flava]|uniref:hypothetical protein n=1 Tax=Solimonas flava TaxID=415849 RepID=UPI000418E6FB|nr:hypothetical protein [Solimonas flava]